MPGRMGFPGGGMPLFLANRDWATWKGPFGPYHGRNRKDPDPVRRRPLRRPRPARRAARPPRNPARRRRHATCSTSAAIPTKPSWCTSTPKVDKSGNNFRHDSRCRGHDDLATLTLPVLPLGTGVLLPEMFVTIALETAEAQAAADAAGDDGQVLVVPRVGTAYAPVGTVAQIEESGDLPNGMRAIVVRGLYRAASASACPAAAPRCGCRPTRAERNQHRHRPRPRTGARVQGGGVEHPRGPRHGRAHRRGARHHRTERGRRPRRLLARPVGRAEGRGARGARRRGAARARRRVGEGDPRRAVACASRSAAT